MISAWDIYLIGNIDSIDNFFVALTFIFAFSIIVNVASIVQSEIYVNKIDIRKASFSIICFFVSLFISYIIPDSKTLASMYVVPSVVNAVQNNKQVQEIPKAVLNLIESYTKPEKEK